jgi:hypothetical protein
MFNIQHDENYFDVLKLKDLKFSNILGVVRTVDDQRLPLIINTETNSKI